MKTILIKSALVLLICALVFTISGCQLYNMLVDIEDSIDNEQSGDDHVHSYSDDVTKESSCTEEGEKTFTCSCGDSYTEKIDKLPHTEEPIPAVAPTCTENGLTEGKKCSECDTVLAEQSTVPATGHSYTDNYDESCNNEGCDFIRDADCRHSNTETLAAIAATCIATGLTEGERCNDCQEILTQQEIVPALGHNYESVVTAPTCTAGGYTTYTCSACSDSYVADEVEANGHSEKTLEAVAPTCTATGLTEGKQCTVCSTVLLEQSTVAATGHTYTDNYDATCNNEGCDFVREADCRHSNTETIAATSATCTATGLTEGKRCKDCQEILTQQEIVPSLGHSYKSVVTAPTCTAGGYTTYTCSACGDSYVADAVGAKGHSEESIPAVAPICTATGLTEGKKCTVCGTVTVEQQVVSSKGHTNSTAVEENVVAATCSKEGSYESVVYCSVCNVEISRITKSIAKKEHTEAIDTSVEATCTVDGLTEGKHCSVCNEILVAQETIPAKGHNEVVDAAVAPTCTATGLTEGKHCTNCDYSVAQETVAALGHKEEAISGKAATCTESGISDGKKCSVCGTTTVEQVEIPSTGHDYNVSVVDATCVKDGLKTFTCKNCPDTYTETISAKGVHSYDNDSDYICNDCGYDTTAYRLANGGFESGMDGWTQVGNIGGVSSDRTYWNEGIEFGMDGDKMYSAYAPGAEEKNVGTLTSSTFVVGGSNFVTFKIGAMRDQNYVYVDVVEAGTDKILACYYNGLWVEADLSGCKLVAYKADLSAFAGKEVYFRISDNADSGYGLFFADSFVTYYESEPDGFNAATPVEYALPATIYDVFNGGFEMGNVQGWWNIGEIGVVTNANGYWGDNIPYEKVGEYLFTGVESFGADTMREGNRGALTSSAFEIGGTGYISFKLGGGGSALCYVQVIDAVTGEVLARYHQQAQRDAILIQYVADLSAYIGRTVRIQVVDQADSGWGCVSFDNVVTYYPEGAALPEGITANDISGNIKYTIENGSFETGNIDGWTMSITEHGAHGTIGWVLENEIDAGWYTRNEATKDGRFLFTFAQPGDINCENTKGTLQSSTFSLKQGSYVSFKFGAAGGAQNHDVYIELCRADGSVIARFYNDAPGKVNTRMNSYYYQYNGIEVDCFFRVVDNSTGDYGCLVIDDFRVNLESAPEGYIAAIQ